MTEPHLRDVVEAMTANVRLSEVLVESQREVIARADSFNSTDSIRWRMIAQWSWAVACVFIVLNPLGWYLGYKWGLTVLDSNNATTRNANDALFNTQMMERKFDQFRDKQIELNKAMADAIEELSK